MSNWEPYSQHIWPNWKLKTGPQLIMRISAAYRAHFPPLIVRARVRIIPCGFRSIWCGNSAVNGAEIPHDRCISAAYRAISAGHSALPHVAVRKFRTVQFGNLHLYDTMITLMPESQFDRSALQQLKGPLMFRNQGSIQ